MTTTTARALADSQPLADNLTALRDRPAVSIAVFGEGWAGDCAGSALAEIARLQAQVDALAGALQNTLYELWSDRHSHQDEEGFRSDFAEEYAALAAAGR